MFGQTVACATTSPRLYILWYIHKCSVTLIVLFVSVSLSVIVVTLQLPPSGKRELSNLNLPTL